MHTTWVRFCFGSPFSSKVVVHGHSLIVISVPLTMNENIKMSHTSAHRKAGGHSVDDRIVPGIDSTTTATTFPELRNCVKVVVAVLGSRSLIVLMVSVDVKQH